MGAVCQCEGTKQDEVLSFTPRPGPGADAVYEEKAPMQVPRVVAKDARIPPELMKLQGFWQTETDRQIMGEVKGINIIWDQIFNHHQSPLRLVGNGGLEMELMGATHKAVYDEAGSGRLRWSDGECWIRA
ncbi:unnamed protein product [Polarella glacialis]|uniref:Uncharacterized protein n=1 Tax=Polarella glacialis TaxID=89957 RepID=A0A813FZJ5_POLGL|nr:unnamed protein product [Polarella glacialis]